jgi:hypothetical protein
MGVLASATMRVRIDIGLDQDGVHTFQWEPTNSATGVEVPRTTLDRWTAEREAFHLAYLRWKRVCEEVEEVLYRTGDARAEPAPRAEVALAAAVKASKSRGTR